MEEEKDIWAFNNGDSGINTYLRKYSKWGFNVIPLRDGSKEPAVKWGKYREKRYPMEKIPQNGNIGVICGRVSSNLVVLDFDDVAVYKKFKERFLDLTESTFIVKTGRGYHVYLRTSEPVTPRHFKGIDILGEGSYAVLPPSVHPGSRNEYSVVRDNPPLKVDAEKWKEVVAVVEELAEENEGISDAIGKIVNIIVQYWKEGQRDEVEFALLGYMRKKGVPKERAREILMRIIEESGDTEKSVRLANLDRAYTLPPEKLVGYKGSGGYKGLKDILKNRDLKKLDRYLVRLIGDVNTSKDEEYRMAYVETGDRIYLAVWDGEDTYKFAYYDSEGDTIELTDYVEINGKIYKPLEIKKGKNGTRLPVRYPSFEIVKAPDVNAKELLDILLAHISKYVDLEESDMELVAFYIIFTWFYRKSNTVAYLRFLGDSGKGKSRMLRVTGNLCFYPLIIDGNATRSAIMRVQERYKGTLVMDEADLKGNQEDRIIKYINSGFEKDSPTILSNPNNPNDIEIYDSFSPKIFSMREPFRDSATEGRILSISPQETLNPDIPPVLPKMYEKEVLVIRDILARFTLKNWGRVDGEKIEAVKKLPIEPRLKQLASPLSVILPLFGDEMDNKFIGWLIKRQKEIAEERANSNEGIVFNAVVDMALGYVTSEELPEYVDYMEEPELRDEGSNGKFKVVTTGMIRDHTGLPAIVVKRILVELGFVAKRMDIKINGKRKTPTVVKIKSTRRWIENWKRYRDVNNIIDVPNQLKIEGVHYPSVRELLDIPARPT